MDGRTHEKQCPPQTNMEAERAMLRGPMGFHVTCLRFRAQGKIQRCQALGSYDIDTRQYYIAHEAALEILHTAHQITSYSVEVAVILG